MRTNVLLMSLMALFLFGCSTSETDDLDLSEDAVILSDSESKSLALRGPPETSGPIVRVVVDIGFYILDPETQLTALMGWDLENYWHENDLDFNMEPNMYQWSELNEYYLTGHGELQTLVFEGTPDWPLFDSCSNCSTWFDDATLLATGTSKFSVVSTTMTLGDTFNGRLMTYPDDDDSVPIMFHAKFKFNFNNGSYVETVSLR